MEAICSGLVEVPVLSVMSLGVEQVDDTWRVVVIHHRRRRLVWQPRDAVQDILYRAKELKEAARNLLVELESESGLSLPLVASSSLETETQSS
jgi:hypothetical protein